MPGGLGRLRSARDVRAVLRRGRRGSTGRIAMHVLAGQGPERPGRLAVVASRRIGNAPARSRAKRLMREAAARVAWPSAHDVVLVARPGIVGTTMWDVHADLTSLGEDVLGIGRPRVVPG